MNAVHDLIARFMQIDAENAVVCFIGPLCCVVVWLSRPYL